MARLPRTDLTGQVFGHWTVLSETTSRGWRRYWLCRCVCSAEKPVRQDHLLSGACSSCGCYGNPKRSTSVSHGLSRTPEYQAWVNLRARCYQPLTRKFHLYGGRGIAVCERWLHSFENFLADLGPRPSSQHSVERRDGNGNYDPINAYWADDQVQNNNTSRNHFIEWNGKRLTAAQWERVRSLSYGIVAKRIHKGWTEIEAISTPMGGRRNRG